MRLDDKALEEAMVVAGRRWVRLRLQPGAGKCGLVRVTPGERVMLLLEHLGRENKFL